MNSANCSCGERLQDEVPISDRIKRISGRAREAECLRRHVAIYRKRGARERRRAQRRLVEALARVGKTRTIAPQHLDIGQKMMAESDRLGRLQMCKARHD